MVLTAALSPHREQRAIELYKQLKSRPPGRYIPPPPPSREQAGGPGEGGAISRNFAKEPE